MLPKNILTKIKELAFDSHIEGESKYPTKWNKHVNQVAPPEYFEARRAYHRARQACVFQRDDEVKKWSALSHCYRCFDELYEDGWVMIEDHRIPSPKLSDFI